MKQNTNSLISLPHSEEVEKAVLGALLIESGAIGEVAGTLTADMFYDSKFGKIYAAIAKLYNENVRPDLITVTKSLMNSGQIDEIGGPLALSVLSGNIASSANIVNHARYLHQLWLARCLAIAGMEITSMATDPTADIDDVVTSAIKKVECVAGNMAYSSRMADISTIASQCVSEYEKRREMARNGTKTGLSTGLNKLNIITGGWKPGQLIVLAARPAMGKTAMLLHFAKSAAKSGMPVVIFSLEMEAQALMNRVLLSESGINDSRFKQGTLHEDNTISNLGLVAEYVPAMEGKRFYPLFYESDFWAWFI